MRKSTIAVSITAALAAQALMTADAANTTRHARPEVSGPAKSAGHFRQPLGSMVLYDQTTSSYGSGIISQNFTSTTADTYNAAVADDFVVTDASGWTVNQVNAAGVYFNGSGPADSFDVNIYPDNGGFPAAAPTCSYSGLAYTEAPAGAFSIPLSSGCSLAQGTYWVSVVANMSFSAGGEFGWETFSPGTTPGEVAEFENPSDFFGTGCTTWTNIQTCITTAGSSTGFQIIGAMGGGGSGIDLTVGLALDNGDPNQCGSATSLDVTQGDSVNFCYTVTNNSMTTLNYQSLSDDVDGPIFQNVNIVIAPGDSYQYNRIVTATATESPNSTWTGADELPGYAPTTGDSSGFIDISGTGTPLGLTDDGSANVTMPFSFNFYGVTSNALCINNNGFVLFDSTVACTGFFSNTSLPGSFSSPGLFPFWDDLYTAGNVWAGTDPGGTKYIVQWMRTHFLDSSPADEVNFEMVLDSTNGDIQFVYPDTTFGGSFSSDDHGASATVGLQYDSSLFNQFSASTPDIPDDFSIDWTATMPTTFSDSAQVTLNVGAPVLSVNPASLSASAPAGSTTTETLTIGNTGNRDLNWNLEEAPGGSQAHFPVVSPFTMPYGDPSLSSTRPAPRSKKAGGRDATAPVPFGGAAGPGYGATFTASGYFYNQMPDLNAPGTLNQVGPGDLWFAGAFVENNFNQEYVINFPGNQLLAVSTADATAQTIGPVTGVANISNWGGMAWDSTTDTTYAIGYDTGGVAHLATLNLSTGAATEIGTVAGLPIDIAIDPQGNMYGVDIIGDTTVAIDKITGASQVIGSIGFNANYAEGLDFDASTGILYFAGYNASTGVGSLYTIDLTTGGATPIGPIGAGDEMDAFAIAVPSGPCGSPADVPWLSESPISGTTAPGGSDDVTVTFDATSLTDGTYDANICVHSDDPANRTVTVPVQFTVGPGGDIIFQNGFEL
ncbi:MAG: hypothetical protein WBQ57_14205 [Rhodanobacteraceae bacterium]